MNDIPVKAYYATNYPLGNIHFFIDGNVLYFGVLYYQGSVVARLGLNISEQKEKRFCFLQEAIKTLKQYHVKRDNTKVPFLQSEYDAYENAKRRVFNYILATIDCVVSDDRLLKTHDHWRFFIDGIDKDVIGETPAVVI